MNRYSGENQSQKNDGMLHSDPTCDWKDLCFQIRTDLLLESAELDVSVQESAGLNGEGAHDVKLELPVREYEKNGLEITDIRIETDKQAKRLDRKKGRYITIYSDGLKEDDGGIHQEAVNEVADLLRQLLPQNVKTVFVAGLGNPNASPDALGPDTISHVAVNRHLNQHLNQHMNQHQHTDQAVRKSDIQVCAMAPGVMAQTGLETAGILSGVTEIFHPDAIVVVDALAARSVTRLGTTIQLTDTGISPGSGVGNHRQEISQSVLGIPVIAIGIPMVVEAAAIIYETIDAIRNILEQEKTDREPGFLNQLSKQEQYHLFRELLEKKSRPLYVTVKDIDEMEKRLSFTLSEAINQALIGMNS